MFYRGPKHTFSPQLVFLGFPTENHPRIDFQRHTNPNQSGQAQAIPQLGVRPTLPHHLKPLEHVHNPHDDASVPDEVVVRLPVLAVLVGGLRPEEQRQGLQARQAERREPQLPVEPVDDPGGQVPQPESDGEPRGPQEEGGELDAGVGVEPSGA